jgi:hypothetical protein
VFFSTVKNKKGAKTKPQIVCSMAKTQAEQIALNVNRKGVIDSPTKRLT